MKKFLMVTAAVVVVGVLGYFAFVYNITYSDGVRAGELIKASRKGIVFKTWECEISQGISGAQIFSFSVLDSDAEVITQLEQLQGQYVKITYVERYATFPWWGESHYFAVKVEKEKSPFNFR